MRRHWTETTNRIIFAVLTHTERTSYRLRQRRKLRSTSTYPAVNAAFHTCNSCYPPPRLTPTSSRWRPASHRAPICTQQGAGAVNPAHAKPPVPQLVLTRRRIAWRQRRRPYPRPAAPGSRGCASMSAPTGPTATRWRTRTRWVERRRRRSGEASRKPRRRPARARPCAWSSAWTSSSATKRASPSGAPSLPARARSPRRGREVVGATAAAAAATSPRLRARLPRAARSGLVCGARARACRAVPVPVRVRCASRPGGLMPLFLLVWKLWVDDWTGLVSGGRRSFFAARAGVAGGGGTS